MIAVEKEHELTESDIDLLEIDDKIEKAVKSSPNVGKLTLLCNTLTIASINEKL